MEHFKIIEWLNQRLQQSLPGISAQERMLARVKEMPRVIPQNARPSAVLILLFPSFGELQLLLIKRTEDGRAHSGQISFPGGRQEPDDANLHTTALREAQEEVGIISSDVTIIGQLTSLYIPVSNFQVFPFIGFSEKKPQFNINKHEVDHPIEVPLKEILNDEIKTMAKVTSPADPKFIRNVHAYKLKDGSVIWGATAMILSELEVILSEINLF